MTHTSWRPTTATNQNAHRLLNGFAVSLSALMVAMLFVLTTVQPVAASNKGSTNSGSGSSGGSSGSGSSGSGSPGSNSGKGGKDGNDDQSSVPTNSIEIASIPPTTLVVPLPSVTPVQTAAPTPAANPISATPSPTAKPLATASPTVLRPSASGTGAAPETRISGVDTRIVRSVKCGSTTLQVEIRVKEKELRVRTSLSPKTNADWTATVLQDRQIAWRGAVRRGALDQKLKNLAGSEMITVRLTSSTGAVCAAEISIPA